MRHDDFVETGIVRIAQDHEIDRLIERGSSRVVDRPQPSNRRLDTDRHRDIRSTRRPKHVAPRHTGFYGFFSDRCDGPCPPHFLSDGSTGEESDPRRLTFQHRKACRPPQEIKRTPKPVSRALCIGCFVSFKKESKKPLSLSYRGFRHPNTREHRESCTLHLPACLRPLAT